MDDTEEFYNREDVWEFPTQLYEGNEQDDQENSERNMAPYYLIMRLPEGRAGRAVPNSALHSPE